MRYVGPRHIVHDGTPLPDYWEPDQSFQGETVAIIGGGPSLATFNLGLLKGHRFVATNSSCRRLAQIAAPDDILYFTDNSWAENRPELVDGWPGRAVTSNRNARIRIGSSVLWFDILELTTWAQTRPDYVQASSAHIAACLAARMGAARLVLIAMECREIGGRTHGHDDYRMQDLNPFTERFIPGWDALAAVFDRIGVAVVNATPGSAITAFPKAALADALVP